MNFHGAFTCTAEIQMHATLLASFINQIIEKFHFFENETDLDPRFETKIELIFHTKEMD